MQDELIQAMIQVALEFSLVGAILDKELKEFMATNPSNEQIEQYYISSVMPYDNRSINEILNS